MVINTQSLKNKEDLLAKYFRSEVIDMVIATVTWLTNQDRDVIWIESNGLVKDGYHISVINRDSKNRGRLYLIYKSNITVFKLAKSNRELSRWCTGWHL